MPELTPKLYLHTSGHRPFSGPSLRSKKLENTLSSRVQLSSRRILLLLLGLMLASCVGPNIDNWPDNIPQQQFFVDAYSADAANQQLQSRSEYLEWSLSFYQGNLAYQSGWLDITSTVLNGADPKDAGSLAVQLGDLGAAIGAEWAKDNKRRLIDSRMLALWGSALQLAEDSEQQRRSIELIARDVVELLGGSMDQSDIVESRYEEILQLEFFGGF